MKKNQIFVILSLMIISIISCVKEIEVKKTMKETESIATLIKQKKSNSYEGTYLLFSHVGHKSTVCNNKCKYANGKYYHIDCQGYGRDCSLRANVNITKNNPLDDNDIYYTATGLYIYEPTEEDTFDFPDRSFYITYGQDSISIWLNIPKQILIRNTESKLFIYNNITFTQEALFENN